MFGNYGGPSDRKAYPSPGWLTKIASTRELGLEVQRRFLGRTWHKWPSQSDSGGDRKLAEQNTDSFWGPSVHWNKYLRTYVMLLNRSCCTSGFPQRGIYINYNPDLTDPNGWTNHEKSYRTQDGIRKCWE